MARGKKKEAALSTEERLEAALVLSWEQPYKVPKNWCWTHIEEVSEVVTGSTPSKANPDYYGTEFPFFKPADLDAGRYVFDASEYLSELGKQASRIIPVASTAICCIGSIGKSGYLNRAGTTNQQINSAIPKINPLYLYYYCNTEFFVNQLWEKSSATTIAIVNKSKMQECLIPLAPLPEQQRIVDRIENLFAKLDEAKEKTQEALDSFEIRKESILQAAFSGELTSKWRTMNGYTIDNWDNTALSEVCVINPPKANTHDLPDNLEVSFFPMPALSEVVGEITVPQTRPLGEVRKGFTNFSEGDVVFAKITPCMENGKSAVIGKLVNDIGYGTTEFYVLRCGNRLVNRFLYHLLRSQTFRDEAKCVMTGAVGQQRVPKSFLEEYAIKLPPVAEQTEVVRVLDAFFAKEAEAKAQVEATLEAIDLMRKSILAKAFRGELGTNDPAEESAESLIRQVLKVDAPTPKRAKAIQISKELSKELSSELEKKLVKLFLKGNADTLRIDTLMGVAKDKFAIMESLRNLEQKQIIKHLASGDYRFMR